MGTKVGNGIVDAFSVAVNQVENSVETAAAQNRVVNDLSVSDSLPKRAFTTAVNGVNLTTSAAAGVVNGTLSAAADIVTFGHVDDIHLAPTARTVVNAFTPKDHKAFDNGAAKEVNKDNLSGEDTTVADREAAYLKSATGTKRVEAAKSELDSMISGASVEDTETDTEVGD